jgi:hypothetical protein
MIFATHCARTEQGRSCAEQKQTSMLQTPKIYDTQTSDPYGAASGQYLWKDRKFFTADFPTVGIE